MGFFISQKAHYDEGMDVNEVSQSLNIIPILIILYAFVAILKVSQLITYLFSLSFGFDFDLTDDNYLNLIVSPIILTLVIKFIFNLQTNFSWLFPIVIDHYNQIIIFGTHSFKFDETQIIVKILPEGRKKESNIGTIIKHSEEVYYSSAQLDDGFINHLKERGLNIIVKIEDDNELLQYSNFPEMKLVSKSVDNHTHLIIKHQFIIRNFAIKSTKLIFIPALPVLPFILLNEFSLIKNRIFTIPNLIYFYIIYFNLLISYYIIGKSISDKVEIYVDSESKTLNFYGNTHQISNESQIVVYTSELDDLPLLSGKIVSGFEVIYLPYINNKQLFYEVLEQISLLLSIPIEYASQT